MEDTCAQEANAPPDSPVSAQGEAHVLTHTLSGDVREPVMDPPSTPPTDVGTPPLSEDEEDLIDPYDRQWLSCADCGVAEDRNARFRRSMEDGHVVLDGFGAASPHNGYFAIYDGHGGRGAVDYTLEHLHLNFQHELEEGYEPSEAFRRSFVRTDTEMESHDVGYSGTTVVAVYLRQEKGMRYIHAANAGDARAVLCRDGRAIRLTRDHKGSDASEVKRIENAGGLVVMQRVNGVLAVTRSLGDHKMKDFVIGMPYTRDIQCTEADAYLIVACDGLWDVVTDQAACDLVREDREPNECCQKKAVRLMLLALRNGTTDNLSIMVIKLR